MSRSNKMMFQLCGIDLDIKAQQIIDELAHEDVAKHELVDRLEPYVEEAAANAGARGMIIHGFAQKIGKSIAG